MRKRSEEELGDEGPWGMTEDGRYDPRGWRFGSCRLRIKDLKHGAMTSRVNFSWKVSARYGLVGCLVGGLCSPGRQNGPLRSGRSGNVQRCKYSHVRKYLGHL
jgi:hypothetical protein